MAEYSRLAKGHFTSTGGQQAVILPFTPDYVEFVNYTASATPANHGVPFARWDVQMGQGYAVEQVFNATPVLTSDIVTSNGISTVQAALALQYGPTVLLGGSGGIAKTSATVLTVTTTSAHGLTTGNWVTFQNLYQSSTTGMQQIAGIPFMVTVTGSTTFTIPWVGNSSNLTAITSGGLNTNASYRQILYPVLYAPGVAVPWSITTGTTTTVKTTTPHNFVVGQEIAFRIPAAWGMTQLNSLPNTTIPGSPIYGFVTSVTDSTTFVCNINSTSYTAFTVNQTFASFPGLKFPEVVAVGDVNTGGYPYAGVQFYPSPTVFNGYTSSTSTGVSTINGPAIQGAYINATWQGFIIGAGAGTNDSSSVLVGANGNVIYWRAYLHDFST